MAATIAEDPDGSATIRFLSNFKKASARIAGSLGLHPAVYFYSATGAYQPAAFLAVISFVRTLEQESALNTFTSNRSKFEDLLLKYKQFINQVVRHYGSGNRSLTALVRLYRHIFDAVVRGDEETKIVPLLLEDERLEFLKPIVDGDKGTKKTFPSERKSAIFLREAIERAVCCGICGARLHTRSITIDHVERRAQGGLGAEDNGQLSHPYCNSTFKG